jgi:glycosyltransferase involved in cell wall biosynthesis
MDGSGISHTGVRVRLAYLCNLYPAVSHSFVRREIEAVERSGHEVHRFSLRPARDDLKDDADLREASRTDAVLGQGLGRLLLAGFAQFLTRPARSFNALREGWRLSGPGLRHKLRHLAYWLEAAWLVRRMEQLKVEHLHVHFGTNPAAVAAISRAWGGPPFSFTVHGPDEFDAPIELALPAKIEAASFVAAISNYGRSQLMRWSSPDQWDKIGVVRCGVDSTFLDMSPDPLPAASREFVSVARLSAQKGLPVLIAACERLLADGEKFSVTVVGDGEMRAQIERDIQQRKLDNVVSLVGVRTSAEIRETLLRARAFVLPSFAEGLPVVIMEALALGRPVISTQIAGIPELVDRECGWLIPAGSEDALVEAMKAALHASADELGTKGRIGRERVLRLHDANSNAAHLLEAIAKRSGRAS